MRYLSRSAPARVLCAALLLGLPAPILASAAAIGAAPGQPGKNQRSSILLVRDGFATRSAQDALRKSQSHSSDAIQFGKQPRATRIANCLRDARNIADQMALQCEAQHPVNKQGNRPGLSDCYDQALDRWRIEEASCRRIR